MASTKIKQAKIIVSHVARENVVIFPQKGQRPMIKGAYSAQRESTKIRLAR
jgi:hypothetical protein